MIEVQTNIEVKTFLNDWIRERVCINQSRQDSGDCPNSTCRWVVYKE